MKTLSAAATDGRSHLPPISISSAMADWHEMLCGPAEAGSRGGSDSCRFLGSRISSSIGRGKLDLVSFDDGFILVAMRGQLYKSLNYKIVGEGWTRIHFRRAARVAMRFDGIGRTEDEGPLCQILHQPEGVGDEEWIEGGAALEWVTLLIRPELLVKRFRLDSNQLVDPVRRLANGADDFVFRNWSLPLDIDQAMSQLLCDEFEGGLRKIHLEAKAIELICMMSNVMRQRRRADLPVKLSKADIERLHDVHDILSRTFDDPPGIEELSRRVGLNRNKLSYGFKQEFDQTISEFCTESRLQTARELLRESEMPISQIAQRVGYSQASAFSSAFRRRFGVPPRKARTFCR